MLAARVSALEDHLWALREDPGYFTTQILEIKEHQLQNLKDQSGKDHPLLLDSQQHKLLAHVMRIPMTEAYWYLEIFSEARRLAKRVAVLQRKYATDITPEKDLPEEYLQALLLFHHFLDRVPDLLQATLWNAAPASPPLRRLFYRQPSRSKTEDIHVWYNTKKLEKEDTVQHQLLWSIMYLWKDNEVLSLTAMPVLVDELERLLRSEPRARAMLTPFVSAALGDLSIIAQCLHQSKLYQPWAWTWESSLVKRREELEKRYFQRFEAFSRHIIILDDDAMSKAGTLCDFPSGKFAYPFGKPHTKANIEALRSAERRLDAVWAVFDNAQSR
ncbi:hypothetical protein BJY01DRAFT_91539 [Aspergillus pseudoustus]|uniref:Uncharacterized protein n=1 Tax=Aspergillus pseudoustus TaxID=1810923 RepID=A0ABR4KJN3_9EURO